MIVIGDQIWMDGWHVATLSSAVPHTVRAEAVAAITNPPEDESDYDAGYVNGHADGVEETDRVAYARGFADALASVEGHVDALLGRRRTA